MCLSDAGLFNVVLSVSSPRTGESVEAVVTEQPNVSCSSSQDGV